MNRAAIDQRLRVIFADLFDLPEDEVRYELTPDTCEAWDSLAHIKLVASIEESFEFVPRPEDEADMISFELIGDIIAEKLPS